MNFKFWGVRGSIPTPGSGTVKYGGNTTCIEIRTDDNDLILLDAGTGIRPMGLELLKQDAPLTANIFITHTHWDHIQGLPFFAPIFISGSKVILHGGLDPVTNEGIERAMAVQLQHSYFPIHETELNANLHYNTIKAGESVVIGSATVTPILLDHPVLNFGYRVDADGQSIFFTGDYEPNKEQYHSFVNKQPSAIIEAMEGVDALIVDSSYTAEEYRSKIGWGHGTYDLAMMLAELSKAKKLFFTHHQPRRTDEQLESIYNEIIKNTPHLEYEIFLAREGENIQL